MSFKEAKPGDLIVSVGGRTGRDGIHGATFSSAELTSESESLSGGAVQIGNAIEEKKGARRDPGYPRPRTLHRHHRLRGRRVQQCRRRDGRGDWCGSLARSRTREVRRTVLHGDLDLRSAGAHGPQRTRATLGRGPKTVCRRKRGSDGHRQVRTDRSACPQVPGPSRLRPVDGHPTQRPSSGDPRGGLPTNAG